MQKLFRNIQDLFPKEGKLFTDIPDLLTDALEEILNVQNLFRNIRKLFPKKEKLFLDVPELIRKVQKLFRKDRKQVRTNTKRIDWLTSIFLSVSGKHLGLSLRRRYLLLYETFP